MCLELKNSWHIVNRYPQEKLLEFTIRGKEGGATPASTLEKDTTFFLIIQKCEVG